MAVQQQYAPPPGPPPQWHGGGPPLDYALHQVVARMRWVRWVRCAAFGALIGEVVALAAVVLGQFDLLPDWLMLEILIPFCILAGVVTGSIVAAVKPISIMAAARIAETRLGLKERLSSALEFGTVRNERDPIPPLLVQLQQRDAAMYATHIRPKEAVPFKWPWQLKALIAMTVVLIVAIVVPNLPMFVSASQRNERGIVSQEGKKLEQEARVIEKQAEAQQLPHTKWAAQQMHRLAQQMTRGKMDKRQAFVKYGKLTQQMQNLQKQLAQNGSAQGGKTMNDAGRQLAQSLQSQPGQNGQQSGSNAKSAQAGQGGNNGQNANGSGKTGQNANAQKGQHGFNVPGFNNNKPGSGSQSQGQSAQQRQVTNEIKQIAKAMQNGDSRALSEQLRQLAQRAQSGQMGQPDQQQAQQDLQKLADALKGTPMKETQQHAQAAADAMKQGDMQKAADEMKKAADAAERESKDQQDSSAMQNAQKSLQQSKNDMAGAQSPGEVGQQQSSAKGQSGQSGDSGNNGDGGQGDSSNDNSNGSGDNGQSEQNAEKEMKGQGSGGHGQGDGKSGDNPGEENGGAGSANRAGRGGGHAHGQRNPNAKWAKFQGTPKKLNSNFDPSKFPKYNKIYLGKPHGGSAQGRLGKTLKSRPGASGPHQVNSQVPYYNYVGPAKKAAEHAVDHEDIPPSYKGPIQKYFDSLTPTQ